MTDQERTDHIQRILAELETLPAAMRDEAQWIILNFERVKELCRHNPLPEEALLREARAALARREYLHAGMLIFSATLNAQTAREPDDGPEERPHP